MSFTLCIFITILLIEKAYGLTGSADFLWEQKKKKNKRINEFTQTYEVIFSRRLQPLYDASLKFEFRSETIEEDEDKERTQLLPAINMRFGQEKINLNLGWSKDILDKEEEGSYTNERVYMGLGWMPSYLPRVLLQFQDQKKDESWEGEPITKDTRITIKEDYTLKIGVLTLDHNLDHERKEIDEKVTTTYDLLNTGRINHRFSFFDNGLEMGTGYELTHGQNREDREGDPNSEDIIFHKKTLKHNAQFNALWRPVEWINPEYRTFWGETTTEHPDKRENSIGHNLSLFLKPHQYLHSTIGMNFTRNEETLDPGQPGPASESSEITTYSLKLDPSLQGLIFDPNIPMYPIHTSFLLSSSTQESKGIRENHTMSFLVTGSSTIYNGVDLDLDMGFSERKDFFTNSKKYEKRLDGFLNMNLLPSLKSSIRQKAEWVRDRGGRAVDPNSNVYIVNEDSFNGSLETRLIFRQVETFMLDAGYTFDYDGDESRQQYSFSWQPTSKLEIDMRYQSGTKSKQEYFSGELNLNISSKIRLMLRYQDPTQNQIMKLQFTVRF